MKGKSATLHAMANVRVTRGDLDGALALYQQSLDLEDRLGDLQGKSATLHAMAGVLVTRGDLDGALALYQQSLDLEDRLGDLQGKSATLHPMANVRVTRGDLDGALALYQQSLDLESAGVGTAGRSAGQERHAARDGQGHWPDAATWTARWRCTSRASPCGERLGDSAGKSATLVYDGAMSRWIRSLGRSKDLIEFGS